MIRRGSVPGRNRVRQRRVRRFVRQIFLAGEEPQERPALPGYVIADRAFEHRIASLECVEHRALRHRSRDLELDLAADMRQGSQMLRQLNPDHGNVWTSTDSTAGRSCTMADQVSPASVDA